MEDYTWNLRIQKYIPLSHLENLSTYFPVLILNKLSILANPYIIYSSTYKVNLMSNPYLKLVQKSAEREKAQHYC